MTEFSLLSDLHMPPLQQGTHYNASDRWKSMCIQTLCPTVLKIPCFLISPVYNDLSKWLWMPCEELRESFPHTLVTGYRFLPCGTRLLQSVDSGSELQLKSENWQELVPFHYGRFSAS